MLPQLLQEACLAALLQMGPALQQYHHLDQICRNMPKKFDFVHQTVSHQEAWAGGGRD